MFRWLLRTAQRRNLVPRMSETERQALAAGTVWLDGELFSGWPDLARIAAAPYRELAPRERAFLDGPAEELCRRVDEWQLSRTRELPREVWDFLKRESFFGVAIPEAYGGLGFSALARSTLYAKLASRSLPLSAVVLIPSSVGPGELLLAYGTEEQKDFFLPRLARGEEIPCFALTEPEAGSDAASLRSEGTVFRGPDGVLSLRLDWRKRYITLAPVATLLGLAFRLRDPENLLGKGPEPGITVALVPTDLPGVEIGRRHDPMGIPFPNGPTSGRGVVVPVDRIIGGPEHAGRGWTMLMEALSAGRSISLPAQSTGGARKVARIAGAYSVVRRQFGVEIGRFEGIEEPLGRIAGLTYLMEAARVVTCSAVDAGERPAVLSAAVKVAQTELARKIVLDGMDILGGAALCRGPRNLLAAGYIGAPIGITVEGANILTRSLILFGQGTIRCHPWLYREMRAIEEGNARELRRALLGHARFFLRNLFAAPLLAVARGRLRRAPVAGPTARYWRRLAWASARFALLTDLALLYHGSRLKLAEKLSGRFADALSWMYLGFCALRRFEAEGRPADDLPLVRWAAERSLAEIQTAFEGIYRNFGRGLLGALLRGPGLFACRANPLGAPPSDRLGREAADALRHPGSRRDRLTAGTFLPDDPDDPLGRLERAFLLVVESAPARERVARAVRRGELPPGLPEELVDAAVAAELLTREEADAVRRAEAARREAIQVDDFALDEYLGRVVESAPAPQTATAER